MTIRSRALVALPLLPLLVLLAWPGAARAGDTAARVTRVRAWLDRADVTYVTRVDVPAGSSTVRIGGIPLRAERSSLRVRAHGVPAEIVSAALVDEARNPKETPEYREAEAEVRRLEDRAWEIDAELGDLAQVRTFLAALKPADLAGKDGATGADAARLEAAAAFLEKRLGMVRKRSLELRVEQRKVKRELELARARLDALGGDHQVRGLAAAVDVVAEQAGSLEVEATVTLRGVSWRPAYRAVYDPEKGKVRLAEEGVVRQDTGLDWNGVELVLSTAAATRGIAPPRLHPPVLHVGEAAVYRKGVPRGSEVVMAAPEPADAARAKRKAVDREARRRTATAERAAWNVVYRVPGRVDVPADGKDHRFLLWEREIPVERTWIVVPEKSRAAWLVAKGKVPEGLPLLAGEVRLFLGEDYAGAASIPPLAPGAELDLPFGPDRRVAVDWHPRVPRASKSGFLGRKRQKVRAWAAEVTNHAEEAIRVQLLAAVPVSSDERIEVTLGEGTTPGFTRDPEREGILRWEFDLAPGASREVTLEYAVRWPKDLHVWPAP